MTGVPGIRGVDVSSWQHPRGEEIDWHAVADAGYRFAIVKATQGVGYVNPWLARDLDDAFAAGLFLGAYHFFEAGVDAAEQARFMVHALMGRHLEVHAWLDYEVPVTNGFAAAAEVRTFLDAARDGRPGTGLYVDGYTHGVLAEAHLEFPLVWFADPSGAAPPAGAAMVQTSWGEAVAGVPDGCDVDELRRVRGINLPTVPKPPARACDVTAVQRAVRDATDPAEPSEVSERSGSADRPSGAEAAV